MGSNGISATLLQMGLPEEDVAEALKKYSTVDEALEYIFSERVHQDESPNVSAEYAAPNDAPVPDQDLLSFAAPDEGYSQPRASVQHSDRDANLLESPVDRPAAESSSDLDEPASLPPRTSIEPRKRLSGGPGYSKLTSVAMYPQKRIAVVGDEAFRPIASVLNVVCDVPASLQALICPTPSTVTESQYEEISRGTGMDQGRPMLFLYEIQKAVRLLLSPGSGPVPVDALTRYLSHPDVANLTTGSLVGRFLDIWKSSRESCLERLSNESKGRWAEQLAVSRVGLSAGLSPFESIAVQQTRSGRSRNVQHFCHLELQVPDDLASPSAGLHDLMAGVIWGDNTADSEAFFETVAPVFTFSLGRADNNSAIGIDIPLHFSFSRYMKQMREASRHVRDTQVELDRQLEKIRTDLSKLSDEVCGVLVSLSNKPQKMSSELLESASQLLNDNISKAGSIDNDSAITEIRAILKNLPETRKDICDRISNLEKESRESFDLFPNCQGSVYSLVGVVFPTGQTWIRKRGTTDDIGREVLIDIESAPKQAGEWWVVSSNSEAASECALRHGEELSKKLHSGHLQSSQKYSETVFVYARLDALEPHDIVLQSDLI